MKIRRAALGALTVLVLASVAMVLGALASGCSEQQLKDAAARHPGLAAATQPAEQVQEIADRVAAAVIAAQPAAKVATDTAAFLGIPYAAWAGIGLAALGKGALWYRRHRSGDDPEEDPPAAAAAAPPK